MRITCVDIDDDGLPIKPCPECKHPFGEHFGGTSLTTEEFGECEHCMRYGEQCKVDQRATWPQLVT